jgi:autotransporter passenger strand-loop-strand repeat protein
MTTYAIQYNVSGSDVYYFDGSNYHLLSGSTYSNTPVIGPFAPPVGAGLPSGSVYYTDIAGVGETVTGDLQGVNGYGRLYVYGVSSDVTVNSSGFETIENGASAVNTTLNGYDFPSLYAELDVVSGGVATGTTVNSGGKLYVASGGSAFGTIANGGAVDLAAGFIADSTTISAAENSYVGVASGVSLSGYSVGKSGQWTVYAGGSVSDLTDYAVYSGDGLFIESGGSATNISVEDYGEFFVYGVASHTNITSGQGSGDLQVVESGGIAIDTTIDYNGQQGVNGLAESTVINGGLQSLSSGGTASNTIIEGGLQEVGNGGIVVNTTISAGTEFLGGYSSNTIIESGGEQVVGSDYWSTFAASATSTTVDSGGLETVLSGSVTSDTTINGGTLELQSGSLVSGYLTFGPATGGTLKIDGTTMPTAVISGFAVGDRIDLAGVPYDATNAAPLFETTNNTLEVVEDGAAYNFQFDSSTNIQGSFSLAADSTGGGTAITYVQGGSTDYTPSASAQGSLSPYYGVVDVYYPGVNGAGFSNLGGGYGTGFVIAPHFVLTAAHVVGSIYAQGDSNTVYLYPGVARGLTGPALSGIAIADSKYNYSLYNYLTGNENISDIPNDLAVAYVPGVNLAQQYGMFQLTTNNLIIGQLSMNATGYPGPVSGSTYSQYNVVGQVADASAGVLYSNTISLSPGYSGGPVWTYDGTTPTAYGVNVGIAGSQSYFAELTQSAIDWINQTERGFSSAATDNFTGGSVSDLLIQNTSGAVVVGEVQNGAATYTQVAALGPEWGFKGNGDFLGDGNEDFLIESASGAVVAGEVANGATTYAQIGALGPEWSFKGAGDFLNNGQAQFLIENAAGAVDVGNVAGGQAQYTQIAALGPEWSFQGAGDFLGDGKTDFLIENASGAVDVGEISNGTATYTQVAALGPEWKFVGTGDFLGNGQDQLLIENSSGAVVVSNVVNGQAQYTQVAALGPEWSFIGTGDYTGSGTEGFMIENNSGAVVLGTIANGQASYAQVGALGAEWTSRS